MTFEEAWGLSSHVSGFHVLPSEVSNSIILYYYGVMFVSLFFSNHTNQTYITIKSYLHI